MAGIEPDWSGISEDLLFSIVKFLSARIHVLRLRAVCRSFRAKIPPPPTQYPFPQSILTNTDFLKGPNPKENGVFTLTASTVYAIEPVNIIFDTQDEDTPQTWVIEVNESNSGRVRIIHPMVRDDIKNSSKLPKSLNLLDYRVTEICKCYELDSAVRFNVSKVVFSSFLNERDKEFTVMARYDGLTKLGMWRNVDQKWSHVDIGLLSDEYFKDIIYYNDKFYALLSEGRTVTVDPKSLIVTQVAADIHSFSDLQLAGSYDDLFLVCHYEDHDVYEDNCIAVFKLNRKERKWVQVVDELDFIDRVLFVHGEGYTFSVSLKEFPRFKGAYVYYVFHNFDDDDADDYPPQSIEICYFHYGAFVPVSDFTGLSIFWPPPAWLKFGDSNLLEVNSLEKEKMKMIKKDRVGNWVLIPAEHVQEEQAEYVPAQVPEEAAEPSYRQGKRPRAEASSSHVKEDEPSLMQLVLYQFQILTTRLDSLTSHVQDGFQTIYNRLDLIDSRLNTLTDEQQALQASLFHPPPSPKP